MIRNFDIHNFKNHADTSLDFGNLTILTGINGMGKSSVLQSMLILREAYFKSPQMRVLPLDGESFIVSGAAALVNRNVSEEQDKLKLKIRTDDDVYTFEYSYPTLDANELEGNWCSESDNRSDLKSVSLFSDNFQYLSAFRIGPQSVYSSNTGVVDKHRQLSQKLGQGEFAVYYLNKFAHERIGIRELAYDNSNSLALKSQVELWMGEISDGVKLQIDQNGNQYELKFGYELQGKTTAYHSALNTGYGISYVLGLVVAILSAQPGALILIENPEAHIHPSGQSALMHLISLAAANGIQIILETHSDHIINGALVNWKQNKFDRNLLSVYYFDRDEKLNAHPVRLTVGENGRIQKAPAGFFDQMRADLEVLFDLE
jgi:predicted ATPase